MQKSSELDTLIQKIRHYDQSPEVKPTLEEVYQIAATVHEGFRRASGTPFLNHALAVADILADWQAPLPVVAVGVLHDIHNPDYSLGYNLDHIQIKLGTSIFELLQSMIELNKFIRHVERDVEWGVGVSNTQAHIASMLQQERDVLVVKMADRLHNLQEISFLTREFQERTARIAFNLLAPLADRLGMSQVKNQLEDYGFTIHQPIYHKMFKEHAEELDINVINTFSAELQTLLQGIVPKVSVEWQTFSLYKLYYHRVEQNARQGQPIRQKPEALMPVDAGNFVILVDEELDCYRALGVLHKHYRPVANIFRDYVGSPKVNGYRSLDTQVRHPSGTLLNLNIRTFKMDLVNKFGITAGWRNVPQDLLPQMPSTTKAPNNAIQILTVAGETWHFPVGATLLDFAFSIHSDLGYRCIGALVNGEPTDIYSEMKTGDRIEIIFSESEVEPKLEWLNHVKTPQAAGRIRQWFTQHKRQEMADKGRRQLDAELKKLQISAGDPLARQLLAQIVFKEKLLSQEDLYISIGVGRHSISAIIAQFKSLRSLNQVSANTPEDEALPKFLARCCRPLPPMDIVGQRRKDQTLLIHTRSCPQLKDVKDLVVVKWLEPGEANHVVVVEARNRAGLASEICGMVSLLNYDMLRFSSSRREGGAIADSYIFLGRTTFEQREHLKKNLEKIAGATSVEVFDVSELNSPFLSPALRSVSEAVSSEIARDPNPYGPGIALGPRFYGREAECQRISGLLKARPQNTALLLWGQKRIGKTSLLHRLEDQSQGRFLPVFIDMHHLSGGTTIQFMHYFMKCTSQILKDKLPELALEVTVPKFNIFKKDPLNHFDAFIAYAGDISKSSSLVMILDEFQCLCELSENEVSRDAIFTRLRSNVQHGRGMHLILSGGGLRSYLTDQTGISSLFTIMHDEKLGYLQDQDASRLIKDGLGKVWTVSDDALRYLLDITGGHPYYLQLLCSKLYDQTQKPRAELTGDYTAQLVKDWLNIADDSRFLHLWEAHDRPSSLRNKLVLCAIAHLGIDDPSVTYEQLWEKVSSIITEPQLMQSLSDLADLGLGVLHHDQLHYSIKVNLFARWLRQHWPYKLVVKECLQQ